MRARGMSVAQLHMLRAQSCGSRCNVASSGPAVHNGDPHQRVVGARFRVFDGHIEIAVVVKDAGIVNLEFWVLAAAGAILSNQPCVRKLGLRILVEHPHVGVGRRAVLKIPQLLGVLAVIAFLVGEAKQALLEDRVAAVPQRDAEAPPQVIVTPAGNAVLTPAIGAAAGMIVREILPGGAVAAVVLADRAPLALAHIRPPAPPSFAGFRRRKPTAFSRLEQATPRRDRVRHRNSLADWSLVGIQHALNPD